MTVRDDCPFCHPPAQRIFHVGELVFGLWDLFPVSPGHALLIPKRHIADWFEATLSEQEELLSGLAIAREQVAKRHTPDGFNIGVNAGIAAGQTVPHLHVHLIPRYAGDVPDPRGGIRHVIPEKGNYLVDEQPHVADQGEPYSARPSLVTGSRQYLIQGGEEDPLFPHLVRELDQAERAAIAVAFILRSGERLLREHLRDLFLRGGRVRLLTGDYLDSTDPDALLELLDLQEEFPEQLELRVFETQDALRSFHPKAYIFHGGPAGGVAYVGSSNLSDVALRSGIEWNYTVVPAANTDGFREIVQAFEGLFAHPSTRPLDAEWVAAYRRRRGAVATPGGAREVPEEAPDAPPEPHPIQREALRALEETRRQGNKTGLVVLATGLGKTWLSALDSARPEFRRLLFVAHREEILGQAMATFRRIRPEATIGLYTGKSKAPHADVLFASVQTLSRVRHLRQFDPRAFDYIVIDEFHHAAARTYRKILDHFDPDFLLGLTATPERSDGGDLLSLCQENLVYRCDLVEGIRRGLLSPFRYFGVPDEVDYTNIPWRSNRFDEEALTTAVATKSRADNALEQLRKHGGGRTLAFCCSVRHANFMATHFAEAGLRAAAVHSRPDSAPRTTCLRQLEGGELDVVFTVDILNEGVDLPHVDTILMLRPTESRILWTQQFGRGLRKAEGKTHLNVIDYIGNHRTFLLKPQTLFQLGTSHQEVQMFLDRYLQGKLELPPGCEVTYDLEAVDLLRKQLRVHKGLGDLRVFYEEFRERTGERPLAVEAYHEGHLSPSVRQALQKEYGSWLRFVRHMGDLDETGHLLEGELGRFLDEVETTPMTKSYKMLVLQAMTQEDEFRNPIPIDVLTPRFRKLAARNSQLRTDVGSVLDDPDQLRTLIEKNPIHAWTGGWRKTGETYFAYRDGGLRFLPHVPSELEQPFVALVRELSDWRLAQYLDRPARTPTGLTIGNEYSRADVLKAFRLPNNPSTAQSGFICRDECILLFVTLEKGHHPEQHRYEDRFLGPDEFRWQSQNQTTQDSKHGRAIRSHQENGIPVYLFVRRHPKSDGRGAPFAYCGGLEFERWEGEKPITVWWRLLTPLSKELQDRFGFRSSP